MTNFQVNDNFKFFKQKANPADCPGDKTNNPFRISSQKARLKT